MKGMTRCAMIAVLACGAVVLGGCGAKHVNITYNTLDKVDTLRQGTVAVRTFVDNRKEGGKTDRIGVVRNGYGMGINKIMASKNTRLVDEVTRCFAEALKSAGYTVVMESEGNAAGHPVLIGEITKFWTDTYMAVWHDTKITLSLVDASTGKTLWTKPVNGNDKSMLMWGATSELQKVVTTANTMALNQAQKEFASDEFYKCIKKP